MILISFVLNSNISYVVWKITKCKEYISEIVLHAEAQALQYQQKVCTYCVKIKFD